MQEDKLPRIFLLTDGPICQAQGTGSRLLKHFSNYPTNKLFNVYWISNGVPKIKKNLYIDMSDPKFGYCKRGIRTIQRCITRVQWQEQNYRVLLKKLKNTLRSDLNNFGNSPDLIYSNCYRTKGFTLLEGLIEYYDKKPKVLQHFHDFMPDTDTEGDYYIQRVKRIAPKFSEIWALNKNMADRLVSITHREIKIVSPFRDKIPLSFKEKHQKLNSEFVVVMLGNVSPPTLLDDLRGVWGQVQKKVDGIGSIQWFCHPNTISYIKRNDVQIGPEIEHCGFVPDEELFKRLSEADMAIVPFNRDAVPLTDYARYSIPSRISELACCGIPMFFIAGKGTSTYDYASEHELGICGIPSTGDWFFRRLLEFMKNRGLREKCGQNARRLAEKEFDIKKYQTFLYNKMIQLSIL